MLRRRRGRDAWASRHGSTLRARQASPEPPRVINLFDADAFGTNAATVGYLPSAGIEVAP
jgi:hypothetical protein